MSCGVGRRHSSHLAFLWLWCRLVAVALIQPLAWELSYATCVAQKEKREGESSLDLTSMCLFLPITPDVYRQYSWEISKSPFFHLYISSPSALQSGLCSCPPKVVLTPPQRCHAVKAAVFLFDLSLSPCQLFPVLSLHIPLDSLLHLWPFLLSSSYRLICFFHLTFHVTVLQGTVNTKWRMGSPSTIRFRNYHILRLCQAQC